MQTNVTLCIKDRITRIPYPAADREEAPHSGFVPLKGRPDDTARIPAVQENEALKQALVRINSAATPFFTVACRKVLNREGSSFWTRGYLEFALNYEEIARDSPNYFILFEQFSNHVQNSRFDIPVDFSFELNRAILSEKGTDGHTACVWITTAEFPSEEGAEKTWNQSVAFLSEFLGSFEKLDLPEIYEPKQARRARKAKSPRP